MKKTSVATAFAAGFVPRPIAPVQDLIQGSGVPSGAGLVWRLRGIRTATPTPRDSVPGTLTV